MSGNNEEGRPPSILSTVFHQPMATLSKSLSSLSLNSVRSQPRSTYSPSKNTHEPSEEMKHGDDIHAQKEGGRDDVIPNISGGAGEEPLPYPKVANATLPATAKKTAVSLAGSVHDVSDGEREVEGRKRRRRRCGLRQWLAKLVDRVKKRVTFKYRVDPHGKVHAV